MARIPVLPQAAPVGLLSAQLRRPSTRSAMSATRRFATSPRRLNWANSCVSRTMTPIFPSDESHFRSLRAIRQQLRRHSRGAGKANTFDRPFPEVRPKVSLGPNQAAERLGAYGAFITPGDGLFYFQGRSVNGRGPLIFAAGGSKMGATFARARLVENAAWPARQPGLKPCEPQSAWSSTRSCRSSFSGARTVL